MVLLTTTLGNYSALRGGATIAPNLRMLVTVPSTAKICDPGKPVLIINRSAVVAAHTVSATTNANLD